MPRREAAPAHVDRFEEIGVRKPRDYEPGGPLWMPSKTTNVSREENLRVSRQFLAMRRNIEALANHSTPDEVLAGRQWYPSAQEHARRMATYFGGDLRHGAGLVSAASPNTEWDLNLIQAHELATTGEIRTHPLYAGDKTRKARRIMEGADPADVLPINLKTGHFFRNIADPTDRDPVTIDMHAHDAALGMKQPSGVDRALGSLGRYNMFHDAYASSMVRLNREGAGLDVPNQLQAQVWTTWKRLNPRRPSYNFDEYLRRNGHYDDYYSR